MSTVPTRRGRASPTVSAPTRQALLGAAAALFLDQGFDATSMEQVRRAAAASNGSLYHHFPTKAHLARALYHDVLGDFQSSIVAAIDSAPSAQAGVEGLVRAHIDWVCRTPAYARVLIELRPHTSIEGSEPVWQVANDNVFSRLAAWVSGHVAEGRIQDLPFDVWMALVVGPLLQLTPRWARQSRPVVPDNVRAALARGAWLSVRGPRSGD